MRVARALGMIRLPLRATTIAALVFFPLLAGCGGVTPLDQGDDLVALCTSAEICQEVFVEECCGSDCGVPMDVPCADPIITGPQQDQIDGVRCVLEAGRDRTMGRYRVSLNVFTGGDGGPMTTTIVNFGDGFASTQLTVMPLGGAMESPAVRRAFKPKAFFDDCLASNDKKKLLSCALEMNESASVAGAVCAP